MSTEQDLKRTALHALHEQLGAKLVPFAGYAMPVQYPEGILREHLHTREQAGLFDVSHMGQVLVRGASAAAALEALVPADLEALEPGRQVYSLFTNTEGGVLDDLIITRWSETEFFLVINAACKAQDIAHLEAGLGGVQVVELSDRALLALQGPRAAEFLQPVAPGVEELVFMQGRHIEIGTARCFVTRSGYTGEDGFEISVPAAHAEALARRLLENPGIRPVGLGARDSLRLEAGLCLYGHELSPRITPVEAGLNWAIAKARRAGGARAGGYPGAARIAEQMELGPGWRRVGLVGEGRAPVREGAVLIDGEGRQVGEVTSGGFGPSVDGPIAMAYVEADLAEPGMTVAAMVRDKPRPMTVTKLPFVPQRYFRG